jgi:DNA-directed RNA polymerase subunit F
LRCKILLIYRPGTYRTYLEYILKIQPKTSSEIKSLYYKILNKTQDDFIKGQINGLLDFIFNPKRENERIEYKNVQ